MISIRETVKRAQAGDKEAFLSLFIPYEHDIYRIAYVYVRQQEDALDVVQETAYRAYKSISSVKDPAYMKTWLIRIAIRSAIDLLRKQQKKVHIDQALLENLNVHDAESEQLPLQLTLQQLIEGLDDEEKSVIILRFYQDYTIREIAEVLELKLGTTKTILYRALHKLRKLAEEGDWVE